MAQDLGRTSNAAMLGTKQAVEQSIVGTDSSAAKGVLERRGAGRIRHLHCPLLWAQDRVTRGELAVEKIKGVHNTADIGTKNVSRPTLDKHLKTLNFERRSGRHPKALKAAL